MARERTIKVAALNIAMHKPHSPERYVELFQDAYKQKYLIRLGNLHGAMLGSLYLQDKEDISQGLNGEIYRFVKLDPNEPWFNAETREEATNDEIKEISIPGHLLPHLQRIPFTFKPSNHQLWFVSQDRKDKLGPASAVSFFQALFNRLLLSINYPTIEVTAIPDSDTVERLLTLPVLRRLSIELTRPNADDGAGEEAKWLRRLEKQKAKRMSVEFVAAKDESIKPDEDTRALAIVASTNGRVSVEGQDAQGRKIAESTEQKPYVEAITIDSDIQTVMGALRQSAGL